ncbi:putative D-lactate mitochondrial [Brachionus plicatilis]|uniref:D-lactate dehydrogenase (cytochrome) n=1 Tax=Brachionus plicatilis TaxID=10195 RepID=A0A3M7QDE3_BRAPC|nr:putative D-lactate mitochondrial [Brachionus plicatilis]
MSSFLLKTAKNITKNLTSIRKYSSLNASTIEYLSSIVGSSNCSVSEAIRTHHSKDESLHEEAHPDIVVFPEKTEQISKILQFCNKNKIPAIPYGAGSGFEGGINAIKGGVSIDTSKYMNNILEVNVEDFDCWVDSGVTRKQLNNYLKDTGLWFPIDPGADACIGGMCSTSASGTNAVRFGTMRENVLNLECVLADGTVINTAGLKARSRKNVAGYNLTNLMIGSEGTLSVITKVALKLFPQPETILSAVAPFPDVASAVQSTVEIMQSGLAIARIEFLDEKSIQANNIYNKMSLDETPTLFLEFHGSKGTVDQQAETAMEICKENQCKEFNWATDPEERIKLWHARHNSWFAFKSIHPNRKAISTDVCVPISKLPEILVQTKKDIEELNLKTVIVGHVGDGNFHTFISLDPTDKEEMNRYHAYSEKLVRHAIKVEGTCTGEHGIGLGKMKYMEEQFGKSPIETMRIIKRALDPNNILNPGKIF